MRHTPHSRCQRREAYPLDLMDVATIALILFVLSVMTAWKVL